MASKRDYEKKKKEYLKKKKKQIGTYVKQHSEPIPNVRKCA